MLYCSLIRTKIMWQAWMMYARLIDNKGLLLIFMVQKTYMKRCSANSTMLFPQSDIPGYRCLTYTKSLLLPFRYSATKRSEEHTSELQSLMRISYAVFCLKKKTHIIITTSTHNNNTK